MNISDIMRKYMKMLEDAMDQSPVAPEQGDDMPVHDRTENGRIDHPEISFEDVDEGKVIAFLKGYKSGRYTKLAQMMQSIATQEAEIKEKKELVKGDTKLLIGDLFSAEDAVRTRIVDTNTFIFAMSKDPEATTSIKYEKVLTELEKEMGPELLARSKELKKQFSTIVNKSPSLKIKAKMESVELTEGPMDAIKVFFAKFKNAIFAWAHQYDMQLESLKRSLEGL
jgi:hypothetical protein